MEKLGVFKIDGDSILFCGCFNTQAEATEYLTEVKKLIDDSFNTQLVGEYIIMPMLHFNIVQTIKTK
tara:strand:- start:604 stop:804 length:201 start_codon:yes stop_codon:yes gene_type:complete